MLKYPHIFLVGFDINYFTGTNIWKVPDLQQTHKTRQQGHEMTLSNSFDIFLKNKSLSVQITFFNEGMIRKSVSLVMIEEKNGALK